MRTYKLELALEHYLGLIGVLIMTSFFAHCFTIYLYNRIGDFAFILVGAGLISDMVLLYALILFIYKYMYETIKSKVEKDLSIRNTEVLESKLTTLKEGGR